MLLLWLSRAMGDGENPSTSRLIVVATVPLTLLLPLFIWATLCLVNRQVLDFPASVTGYITAANTLVLGAFHLNKKEETK
jgi:hypothetical protein